AGAGVRAIAKRLILRAPATAPVIRAAGLKLHEKRFRAGDDRFHCSGRTVGKAPAVVQITFSLRDLTSGAMLLAFVAAARRGTVMGFSLRRGMAAAMAIGVAVLASGGVAHGAQGDDLALWRVYDSTFASAKYIDLTHAFAPRQPMGVGFDPIK